MYGKILVILVDDVSVYIFCDVLKEVIVVVVYFRVSIGNVIDVGFLVGKVKVVLIYGYIIFCLELCVGVFVIELVEIVKEELDIVKSVFCFYLDSRVVLGYILVEVR